MRSNAQTGALVFGVVFLLVGVLGLFVDGGMSMLFGLVPIGSHDIWLHALLAAGLAWIGWGTREVAPRTTASAR